MAQAEQLRKNLTQPGILAALGAALLFGSGTPLAKLLLADVNPWLMAALLYLGSGIGLTLYRLLRKAPTVHLSRGEWPWLAGAIFTGGGSRPRSADAWIDSYASFGASLLLNAEKRLHRAPGLVRLQGKLRQAHCARHGGDSGRFVDPELARRGEVFRCCACLVRIGGLFLLGGSITTSRARYRSVTPLGSPL